MANSGLVFTIFGAIMGVISLVVAWRVGHGLQEDIGLSTKATLAAIEKNSDATLRATLATMEKNSEATLKAIEAAHGSIKEELK